MQFSFMYDNTHNAPFSQDQGRGFCLYTFRPKSFRFVSASHSVSCRPVSFILFFPLVSFFLASSKQVEK
jgi:hypothetical protein